MSFFYLLSRQLPYESKQPTKERKKENLRVKKFEIGVDRYKKDDFLKKRRRKKGTKEERLINGHL